MLLHETTYFDSCSDSPSCPAHLSSTLADRILENIHRMFMDIFNSGEDSGETCTTEGWQKKRKETK